MTQDDAVKLVHVKHEHVVDIENYLGVCPNCGKLVMRSDGATWRVTGWGAELCAPDPRAHPVFKG